MRDRRGRPWDVQHQHRGGVRGRRVRGAGGEAREPLGQFPQRVRGRAGGTGGERVADAGSGRPVRRADRDRVRLRPRLARGPAARRAGAEGVGNPHAVQPARPADQPRGGGAPGAGGGLEVARPAAGGRPISTRDEPIAGRLRERRIGRGEPVGRDRRLHRHPRRRGGVGRHRRGPRPAGSAPPPTSPRTARPKAPRSSPPSSPGSWGRAGTSSSPTPRPACWPRGPRPTGGRASPKPPRRSTAERRRRRSQISPRGRSPPEPRAPASGPLSIPITRRPARWRSGLGPSRCDGVRHSPPIHSPIITGRSAGAVVSRGG